MYRSRKIKLLPDQEWVPNQINTPFPELLTNQQPAHILYLMEDIMCMRNYDELESEETLTGYKTVEIEVDYPNDTFVWYEFRGALYEYNGLPCRFEIDYAERIEYDETGKELVRVNVKQKDIPALWSAAEKKGVEQW